MFAWVSGGRPPVRFDEVWRAGVGSLVAIALTGVVGWFLADLGLGALLIGPVGASAVLLFAAPASPLAQPRAVLGGNIVSALVGVTCAQFVPDPILAAALAVSLAIVVMSLLGCLHPPGGAMALTAVVGGPAIAALGYGFVLVPVALCSLLLVAAAVALNRLMGRAYPHRVPAPVSPHATSDPAPLNRVGFKAEDLDRALAEYGALLDVSREDLDALFRQVEQQAHRRLHSAILCGEIMSRDVITVDLRQTADSALAFLQSHDLRTAPVLDERRRVVGMVRRAELMSARGKTVEAALDPFVHKVRERTPVEALLPLLSSGAVHEAMVVDQDRVLLGIITQTDLLAVLYRAHIVETVVAEKNAA
jgi:CBS domain-containing membrane protein